jgi:hypothetical protein
LYPKLASFSRQIDLNGCEKTSAGVAILAEDSPPKEDLEDPFKQNARVQPLLAKFRVFSDAAVAKPTLNSGSS